MDLSGNVLKMDKKKIRNVFLKKAENREKIGKEHSKKK